jgi:hypothetical protein
VWSSAISNRARLSRSMATPCPRDQMSSRVRDRTNVDGSTVPCWSRTRLQSNPGFRLVRCLHHRNAIRNPGFLNLLLLPVFAAPSVPTPWTQTYLGWTDLLLWSSGWTRLRHGLSFAPKPAPLAKLAESPPQTITFASVRQRDSFLTCLALQRAANLFRLAMLLFERSDHRIRAHFSLNKKYG